MRVRLSIDKVKHLNLAHKRVIRTIMALRGHDHTNDNYKRLRFLKLKDYIEFRYADLVFEAITNDKDTFQ